MSLVGTDPQDESVVKVTHTQATENANIYRAKMVIIDKPLNNPAGMTVEVHWVRCYYNAGTLVPVEGKRTLMNAVEIGPYLLAQVIAGNTLEADFKEKLWAAIAVKEGLPAGTVV